MGYQGNIFGFFLRSSSIYCRLALSIYVSIYPCILLYIPYFESSRQRRGRPAAFLVVQRTKEAFKAAANHRFTSRPQVKALPHRADSCSIMFQKLPYCFLSRLPTYPYIIAKGPPNHGRSSIGDPIPQSTVGYLESLVCVFCRCARYAQLLHDDDH